MQQWIDALADQAPAGTLAADAELYLATLQDRPKLQAERTHQLSTWAERWPRVNRRLITSVQIQTAVSEMLAAGRSASSVKHYLTALHHLWTTLDGRGAPNPVRDVTKPSEPAPLPRALAYDVIELILAELSDRRDRGKLTASDVETIRQQLAQKGANLSAIARAYQVTPTAIRKIARGRRKHDAASAAKTRARLTLMAYTGIPPAQIATLTPADVDLEAGTVLVRPRRKGKGAPPSRHPLTAKGLEAMRAFTEADAWGAFSTSSVHKRFRAAIARLCDRLESDPQTKDAGVSLRVQLADARPYDLRHSFLTQVQIHTGERSTVQAFGAHADARTTARYTLAAVPPAMLAAVERLNAAGFGQAANGSANISTPEGAKTGPIEAKRGGAAKGKTSPETPKSLRKTAK